MSEMKTNMTKLNGKSRESILPKPLSLQRRKYCMWQTEFEDTSGRTSIVQFKLTNIKLMLQSQSLMNEIIL